MYFRHKYSTIGLLAITMMFVGVICLFAPGFLKAQTTLKIFTGKDVVVKVTGTSNLNNWTMTSMTSKSEGKFIFDANNKLLAISSVSFSIPAKSLKSGDKTMDARAYKILKADDFAEITFKPTNVELQSIQKNDYSFKLKGDLCIGGTSRPVIFTVNVVAGTNNTLACRGTQKIKLSDYNINPPGLLFDVFRVNDIVTIQYTLIFKK